MKKNMMIFLIVTCFILLPNIYTFASDENKIPIDAVEYENHYYKLYELSMSWEDAQKYFENIGGHLATITSQEENNFIIEYIASSGYSSAYFGATDKETEGVWQWITGENFIYNNWHKNEPNNENGNEDYAMFYYKYPDGTWNDGGAKFDNSKPRQIVYICEWDDDLLSKNDANDLEDADSVNDHQISQQITNTDEMIVQSTEPQIKKENINTNENKTENTESLNNLESDREGYIVEIHIDNLSLFGGISLIGGISFIGFIIKKRNEKEK